VHKDGGWREGGGGEMRWWKNTITMTSTLACRSLLYIPQGIVQGYE